MPVFIRILGTPWPLLLKKICLWLLEPIRHLQAGECWPQVRCLPHGHMTYAHIINVQRIQFPAAITTGKQSLLLLVLLEELARLIFCRINTLGKAAPWEILNE